MTATAGPVVLIIRDGWGENPNPSHDAFNAPLIARARGLTPVDDALRRDWPWTLIKTSGADVGLPPGTMGNSEVGHQNIGAGRIVEQESKLISDSLAAGLEHRSAVREAAAFAKARGGALHLMGIASDSGVHGLLEHLYAFVRAAKTLGVARVYVHLFTDGRDAGPRTGAGFADAIDAKLSSIGVGRVASVVGRYYAMDRDYRWERVKIAYDLLTGRGECTPDRAPRFTSARAAIQWSYDHPAGPSMDGDEFVRPAIIADCDQSARESRIGPGDGVIFYNFRGDRPRELSAAFVFPDDQWRAVKPSPDSGARGFDRGPRIDVKYCIMTEYWTELLPHCSVVFPKPPKMVNILGQYISDRGLRQFRCAETEKYPHVTFFFNDYRDPPFPGERRENPQSPRVATYDLAPEMAAAQVREAVISRLRAPDCEDLIVVNFANADMVGHTGSLEGAIKACAAVDQGVGAIMRAALDRDGSLVITADHGNAEQMWSPADNAPHTAHTTYDVALFTVGDRARGRRLRGDRQVAGWFDPTVRERRGRLGDIAPTVLELMDLPKPAEMTGSTLLLPA